MVLLLVTSMCQTGMNIKNRNNRNNLEMNILRLSQSFMRSKQPVIIGSFSLHMEQIDCYYKFILFFNFSWLYALFFYTLIYCCHYKCHIIYDLWSLPFFSSMYRPWLIHTVILSGQEFCCLSLHQKFS